MAKKGPLFVRRLSVFGCSGFPPEQKKEEKGARQKKNGGNEWTGPPITEPSFFTFVVSTFATILSTRVLRIVAKVLTTKVKNEGSVIGGPVHSFPPFFFWRAPFSSFFCSGGNPEHPKTDRRRTKRGPFFAKMIIPPPHHAPIVAIFRLISSSAG